MNGTKLCLPHCRPCCAPRRTAFTGGWQDRAVAPREHSPRPAADRPAASAASTGATPLSYKFQRLREKLRAAVASGELSGKLPGERALAKRFHVNAKTLSKALTDLAAEGVLERSIGRGTYVKGSAPAPAAQRRWLALCDPQQGDCCLVHYLRRADPDAQVHV